MKVLHPTKDASLMAHEVEMLREFQSDHIVEYIGSCYAEADVLWIVMECCEGSMLDIMEATGRCLTERQVSACCAAAHVSRMT